MGDVVQDRLVMARFPRGLRPEAEKQLSGGAIRRAIGRRAMIPSARGLATLWHRGVRVGCGLLLPVESPPHAGLARPAHQRAAAHHAGSPARTAAPGGARVISSSSCRSASGPSSCIIDHRPQPVIQRRQIRQQPLGDRPAVQGPALPSPPAPAATPGAVCRNAASTDSQNRCGSRSSRPAGTRATRSDSPAASAWPIQDRSSTVFPLPGPGHVITDMGSLDMTKHNRDLVKRGAAPSTSGSGQVTGPAGGDPRAQRRRGSGLCWRTWSAHRRPGAGREAQRLAGGGLHSSGLR
jgi:hypothetical protein